MWVRGLIQSVYGVDGESYAGGLHSGDSTEAHAVVVTDNQLDVLGETGGQPCGHLVVTVLGGPVGVCFESQLLNADTRIGGKP